MRNRQVMLVCGPKEDATESLALAVKMYGKIGDPAALVIVRQPSLEAVPDFVELTFQDDPYRLGEPFGFLASCLANLKAAETADDGFVAVCFINPYFPAKNPIREMQQVNSLADGFGRFFRLVSERLKNDGSHSDVGYDIVFLISQAVGGKR